MERESGGSPEGIFPLELANKLPYKFVQSLKILGVVFDDQFGFKLQIDAMLDRAKVRHGVMARLARSSWGLEVGVLRTTHTALLTSMTRYALVTIGSGAYEKQFRHLETQHTNISARRITGISRSARLMTLHMCADIRSVANLYIRQCALMLDRVLRAANCSIQTRMGMEMEREYCAKGWETEICGLTMPVEAGRLTRIRGIQESDVEERRMVSLLRETPGILGGFRPVSTFYTEADLIVNNASLLDRTYCFQDTGIWWRVGLQILHLSGWRPDCASMEYCNVDRAVPPSMSIEAPIIVGAPDAMRWYPDSVKETMDLLLEKAKVVIEVEAKTFYHSGVGISCAHIKWSDGSVSVQGRIVGEAACEERPAYLSEMPLLHALRVVEEALDGLRAPPECIKVTAGSALSCRYLLRWFNKGSLGLKSAVASEIIGHCNTLAQRLPCPLFIYSRPSDKPKGKGPGPRMDEIGEIMEIMYERATRWLLSEEESSWRTRLRRMPWTKEEVHEQVDKRYEQDEAKAVAWMSEEASRSCGVFQTLRLDRTIIREALKKLRHSRITQATLCSILCATRFKYFSKEGLGPTVCSRCGQTDSYQHLVRCTDMGKAPTDPEALADYLAEMAERACVANPNLPIPVMQGGDQEIDRGENVDAGKEFWDTEDESSGVDLEFEEDEERVFDVEALLRI